MKNKAWLLFLLLLLAGQTLAGKVGLVLSGGGARGLAHIGVIRALEEKHVPIDYIVGTSAGAVVGCLYAMGYSPREMDSIVRTADFQSWATGKMDPDFNYFFTKPNDNASWITLRFSTDSSFQTSLPTNLVSSVPYDYALMRGTGSIIARAGYDFNKLFIPYRCVASDIINKESVVFRSGDLARAVRASSAYPFYFRPITIDGKILYDGGMYNNFPADVLQQEFHPDYIIGINASGNDRPASETDIVSLLQVMMTTPSSFSMKPESSLLIDLNTEQFELFDFSNVDQIIQEGYNQTIQLTDSLTRMIGDRSDSATLSLRRISFRKGLRPILIDDLHVSGINSRQAEYVRMTVKRDSGTIALEKIRPDYFRLIADANIRQVDPQLMYDSTDNHFDLHLKVTGNRDLVTQFGGNLSSRPISEAFAGITYNVWAKRAYSFNSNFYFGKLYSSAHAAIRMDAPTQIPYYLAIDGTINQYDFYRSSNALFLEQRPSYILKSDYHVGLESGIPAGNKAKIYGNADYIRIADNYYQTQNFLSSDTADKTVFHGITGQLTYEWNTLNRKQFASEGAFFQLRGRVVSVDERTTPGSTSAFIENQTDYHWWVQASMKYDNYFLTTRFFKTGFFIHGVLSTMPFFNNYTVTTVNAPAFEPILEMQTLYLPAFHANAFAGGGLRNVVCLRKNLDLRLEGYLFQPYEELIRNADNSTAYGEPFAKRYLMASGGLVFHSPVGPLSLHVNYYDERSNTFSVLFTAGFLLFNRSALN